MEYREFEEIVIRRIKELTNESAEVTLHSVSKNNGIRLNGVVILRENEKISPTVYLEPFFEEYEEGGDMEDIVSRIIRLCNEQRDGFDFDVEDFRNIDKTREKIFYKLVNYEKNKELLLTVPYRRVLDLAIVYYVIVSCNELGSGSILIKNEHLEFWNISEEELFAYADSNTPKKLAREIKSMSEVIAEYAGRGNAAEIDEDGFTAALIEELNEFSEEAPIKMFVMTNKTGLNGAAVILYEGAVKSFAEKTGFDVYILPSSIHEVILVPATPAAEAGALLDLVREVNAGSVSTEEWLSDNIYYYSNREDTIKIIEC